MTWEVRESMLRLRRNALEHEMFDLAILYGISVIRLGDEAIKQYIEYQLRISGEN